MSHCPIIGISIGDLAGIGTEVLIKALAEEQVWSDVAVQIYGHPQHIAAVADTLGLAWKGATPLSPGRELIAGQVYIKHCWEVDYTARLGSPDSQSGELAFASLDTAVDDLVAGTIDALVTAPIDKQNIQSKSFAFPGHTEYLAMRSETQDYLMLLASGDLRVGVVTGHIPVSEVSSSISGELIMSRLRVIDKSLRMDFGIASPRIAVLGLNPHAGDQGLLGLEEIEIIAPTIAQAQAEGITAEGPFPADGLFGSSHFKDYDAILGMYHDQGLVPFKALSFGSGVNCTVGLPIIRTSPDHGTAYDIAAEGTADPASMLAAIAQAQLMIAARRRFAKL